jgi:hypothetical protein
MYKELIIDLSKGNKWVAVQSPCSVTEIKHAEKVVGHPFPKELKDLLRETDGDQYCLMSAKEIIEHAESSRKTFLPLFMEDFSEEEYCEKVGNFIFFARNGCGDYYGYRVHPDGNIDESAIYIWEHERMSEKCCWKMVSSSMTEFITRCYKNEI